MSEHVFYSTKNDHHKRELTIVNAALLVSKPPTKEKRIRIKVRMLLSDNINMGAPAWLDKAYAFVADTHDTVTPNIEFKGYDLHFSADNLFDEDGVKSPHCQMRSFEIHECGDSEEPDVAASFTIYAPFSTALWAWLGQFGGEECWCSFTPGVPTESPTNPEQPTLTSGSTDEEEESEEEFDDEEAEEIDADSEAELDPDNEVAQSDITDVMLEDALHVFQQEGRVSASAIQRVLSINYAKAGHIIDALQKQGYISEPDTNRVRKLLTRKEEPTKSGPKELAAYHESVLDAEASPAQPKRGRGRPRKTPVDPLTVEIDTAF